MDIGGSHSNENGRIGWVVLAFFLFPFSVCPVMAKAWRQSSVLTKHYLALSGDVGYFSLLENIADIETRGGASGGIGIGYELRYNGLWVNAGLDVQFSRSTLTTQPYNVDRAIMDTQGKVVQYHYTVQGYTDTQNDLRIGLPVLVGFYTNGFYFGGGVRVSYAPLTFSTPTVRYTTRGEYEKYIDDFTNMPNHFYTEYTTHGRSELKMIPQLSVVGEIGYDVLNKERMNQYARCSVLKVALYAEYGMLSCLQGTQSPAELYMVDTTNPSQLVPVSYYVTKDLRQNRIVPLFIGVRVTFMLRIKTANCHCDGAI